MVFFAYLIGFMLKQNRLLLLAASLIFLILIAVIMSFFVSGQSFLSPTIAYVKIEGEILSTSDTGFLPMKTAFDLIDELNEAERDPTITAIFIEINSSGGSAVASKQLYEKIRNLSKPTIVWISDIGTSGAYYVASAADLIIADADSITGSIGVISIIPNYSGLLEKIGVKVSVLKEGEYKDIGSPFREMTADENELFQEILQQIYLNFKKNVLSARKGKLDERILDELADGRILTGLQAKKAGLIDEVGSREHALLRASELAGFKGMPSLKSFEKQKNTLLDLIARAGFSFGAGFKAGLSIEQQPKIKT